MAARPLGGSERERVIRRGCPDRVPGYKGPGRSLATPHRTAKIYPFCAYNSGPVYRERIEREFSVPFEQQPALKLLQLQGKKGTGISEPELVG